MKSGISALTLTVLSLLIVGCRQENTMNRNEIPTPVSVADITYGSISRVFTTNSTAISNAEAELSTEMAGKYNLQKNPATGKPYKLGDKVKKGALIVRIEDKAYENGISIESKRLNLELAEQEQAKTKSLYDKGGATLTEVKNSDIKIMNSRLDYENAEMNLEKMNIRAPFDGVIVNLPHFSAEARVNSGTSVVTIMDYSSMLLEINLPESAINEVKVGQKAYITHYTLPKDTIIGEITELSPAISAETRTFKGKLVIDNKKLLIRPGMFVKADIVTESHSSTIVIPKNIVRNERNRRIVFVVDQGIAKAKQVKLGLEEKNSVEVLSGLDKDDQLIVRGFETLRDGSKVKIQR
jgi:RND family efflux transporter MFP subunit